MSEPYDYSIEAEEMAESPYADDDEGTESDGYDEYLNSPDR
ncbi:hypothetical protein [Streptomyces sp. NBC_00316]|nr:hypothetical protein [Streptomyces sp. NBC_00316]